MSSEAELPPVPITVEGAAVLHQMLRFRWPEWRALASSERNRIMEEAVWVLKGMEARPNGSSGLFTMLGHKADLLFIHFRETFEELSKSELRIARLALWAYLEPVSSYLSVVELGLYESTIKTYTGLAEKGIEPNSEEWNAAIAEVVERQKEAMRPRLYPEIPPQKYICFYPMDRLRGEDKNWYQVPMAERQKMMHDHGMIGRRYAGEVKQIITGSIGLDDWEWGVDLFANDPLVFKRLIYEMRFDEVSAIYAKFGTFYVGLRCPISELKRLLNP
jgi:peroxiredoxin